MVRFTNKLYPTNKDTGTKQFGRFNQFELKTLREEEKQYCWCKFTATKTGIQLA